MRNDKCLAFVHAIVLTNNSGPLHESYPPEGMIFCCLVLLCTEVLTGSICAKRFELALSRHDLSHRVSRLSLARLLLSA